MELRKRGLNRVGNLLVPNSNYCAFEDWVMPVLDAMKAEQDAQGTAWTPSKASLLGACFEGQSPRAAEAVSSKRVPVQLCKERKLAGQVAGYQSYWTDIRLRERGCVVESTCSGVCRGAL